MCQENGPGPIKESEVFQELATIDAQIESLFNKLQPILFVNIEESPSQEKQTKTELLGRLNRINCGLARLINEINL